MRRMRIAVVLAAALALAAAAAAAAPKGKAAPTKLTIWVGWSPATHELNAFKKLVTEYDAKHPEVQISVVGNINDDKILAAIRGGNAPDVVSSFTSSNVGSFCTSGAWIDLTSYLKKDHINVDIFPKATQYYTQYAGKRCALPLLADTFGLYYNTKLFKQAGITRPPRTMSELAADAKKLTQKNSDGSFKVVGYTPFSGFYDGAPVKAIRNATLWGARFVDAKGHSVLGTDPGWARSLKWQKNLIDWYGYSKLVRFQSGLGDEFSASNAFELGKLAMVEDGEWRVAFIQNEHPELQYATAPLPVADDHPELYGSGYINGTIIGIPKGGHHGDQAWALVKYLTTDTHFLAQFSNEIRNVPTTRASLTSPEIKPDPHFATFLKIFANPKSTTSPITAVGAAYQDLIQSFVVKYQAGHVADLVGGLKNVDKQIDAQLAQAKKGGSVP
jgi:multiple sugar transport system substrate-binding protein